MFYLNSSGSHVNTSVLAKAVSPGPVLWVCTEHRARFLLAFPGMEAPFISLIHSSLLKVSQFLSLTNLGSNTHSATQPPCPWASYLTSLNLSFLFYKMRVIILFSKGCYTRMRLASLYKAPGMLPTSVNVNSFPSFLSYLAGGNSLGKTVLIPERSGVTTASTAQRTSNRETEGQRATFEATAVQPLCFWCGLLGLLPEAWAPHLLPKEGPGEAGSLQIFFTLHMHPWRPFRPPLPSVDCFTQRSQD